MTAIGDMFRAGCNAGTRLFKAAEKTAEAAEKSASALVHLATWADETSGAFADDARLNRAELVKNRLALLEAEPAPLVIGTTTS